MSSKAVPNDFDLKEYEDEPDVEMCLTQNSVLRITLTGRALVFTILIMIAAVQVLRPSLTCTLIALSPIPCIIYNDYENFILLGAGGTPQTLVGYLTIAYLRFYALSNPYEPAVVTERVTPSVGLYENAHSRLPIRNGSRPTVAGIAPQRQIDQPGCKKMYQLLRSTLKNIAVKYPDRYRVGRSCFEKRGLALFALNTLNQTCRGEICHIHHSDKSMHLNLHPDDAKIILEKGWGQRHPLAKGGWMKQYVPREFTMIYAPRDRTELDVVCRIIEAAAYWVSGERLEIEIYIEDLPERIAPTGDTN